MVSRSANKNYNIFYTGSIKSFRLTYVCVARQTSILKFILVWLSLWQLLNICMSMRVFFYIEILCRYNEICTNIKIVLKVSLFILLVYSARKWVVRRLENYIIYYSLLLLLQIYLPSIFKITPVMHMHYAVLPI